MFSGFSNQVNSWMGAVKGEPHDEEVPTPTAQQQAELDAAAATAAASASAAQSTAAQQQQQSDGLAEGGGAAADGGADGGVAQAQSPTKAGGMFSGMKTQMSGWLGNAAIPTMPSMPAMPAMPAIPSMPTIPGLRKAGPAAGADAEAAAAADAEAAAALQTDGLEGGATTGDEEDRSSATEGADSGPVSGQGTPSEEKAGQIGNGKPTAPSSDDCNAIGRSNSSGSFGSGSSAQALKAQFQSLFDRDTLSGTHAAAVTTKVTQGAKTFGSFLYSAANKAGSKIKESVKSNPILGEFNKEQDAFIRGQQGADAPVAPWVGHPNEEQVKEEILGLSADRRNFVRAPPTGVEFEFNYDVSYPIAVAIMSEDAALEKMRFDLVPKIITEENFWRNYFYRVSLICQASDADAYGSAGAAGAAGDLNEAEGNARTVTDAQVPANSVSQLAAASASSTLAATKPETAASATGKRTISETEFVSDTFQATETDLEEVKAGIRLLGIDSLTGAAPQVADTVTQSPDEQWEKQLASELQDFELVDDARPKSNSTTMANAAKSEASNWESDLLDEDDEDCEDLK